MHSKAAYLFLNTVWRPFDAQDRTGLVTQRDHINSSVVGVGVGVTSVANCIVET